MGAALVNFARGIFGDRLIWTLFIKLEFIFERRNKDIFSNQRNNFGEI
jgi:hypothetical protein